MKITEMILDSLMWGFYLWFCPFYPICFHLQVVYREMCSNHAEAMVDLQARGVTGSKELLRYFMQERK